jgi:hypothetical protein
MFLNIHNAFSFSIGLILYPFPSAGARRSLPKTFRKFSQNTGFLKKSPQRDSLSFCLLLAILRFFFGLDEGWQAYRAAFHIPFVMQLTRATRAADRNLVFAGLNDRVKGRYARFAVEKL